MKEGIHPELHKIMVNCSCGHKFETLSTMPKLSVAICSHCHPYYTGKQKIMDTAGRVEKFKTRYAKKDEPVKKGPRAVVVN